MQTWVAVQEPFEPGSEEAAQPGHLLHVQRHFWQEEKNLLSVGAPGNPLQVSIPLNGNRLQRLTQKQTWVAVQEPFEPPAQFQCCRPVGGRRQRVYCPKRGNFCN